MRFKIEAFERWLAHGSFSCIKHLGNSLTLAAMWEHSMELLSVKMTVSKNLVTTSVGRTFVR